MKQGIYDQIIHWLHRFPEEQAHALSMRYLSYLDYLLPRGKLPEKPIYTMGLHFPNPIGLAAGFDKNGDYFHCLGRLGFGFIEIGTVTPLPQPGNPQPRLFRIPAHQAIINRMGFNNKGVDHLIKQVKKNRHKYAGILGINIGKNAQTPMDKAIQDYQIGFEKVYPYADYIAINISSPNTQNLRNLQEGKAFDQLCHTMKTCQTKCQQRTGRHVPIVIKIAPDLNQKSIESIAMRCKSYKIEGLIATNTSCQRPQSLLDSKPIVHQSGGLSGAPLFDLATPVITQLQQTLNGQLPIIAAGGIDSKDKIKTRTLQGATLFQIYSGLIYGLLPKDLFDTTT